MRIVAIGGGEIGRPGYPVETTEIDKEIIRLTGKRAPKFLFLPTASSDSGGYIDVVHKHFGKRLGCKVSQLCLINKKMRKSGMEEKILGSDIIYVGGGNTLKMISIWKKVGLDKILKKAAGRNIVLSGVSAGAVCWFKYGSSDSRRFDNPDADLIKINGLNFIPALFCPHCDVEKDRKANLKKLMKKTPGIALAFDNRCAIEIIDDKYRIINSKAKARAFRIYWKKGKYYEEEIRKRKELLPLKDLLSK